MKIIRYILGILVLISFGLVVLSFFRKNSLPDERLINQSLYQAPVQKEIDLSSKTFEIEKEGFLYKITPLYEYEIYGLSVADYDSENWIDYFHKKDPLNTKDICLIWGENVKSGSYKDISFKHGEFTCYWKTDSEETIFDSSEISNNHLLPATEEIYKEIKKAEKGDQIYIKGYLANYEVVGLDTHFFRSSSITREDVGDCACEVVYVTDFKVLVKGNIGYSLLYRLSKYSFFGLLAIYLVVLYISFISRPPIRRREVIKEVDVESVRGRSFPSHFKDNF